MKNSRVDLNLIDKDNHAPVGYKKITCHIIFDVEMDLTRKARYLVGGNLTNPPLFIIYVSMVSRDGVRLALLISKFNNLDILAGDIQN